MKIIGIDKQKVEIKIEAYQFSKNSRYVEDRNWLNVFLNAQSKKGNWKTTDPALTTSDMVRMKNWFREILENGKPNENVLEFIEPNLSFELLEDSESDNLIRVKK